MKKIIVSGLIVAATVGSALMPAANATAQQFDRGPPGFDHRGPPPPPPQEHRRRHNNGGIIAGGIAAGVIGGLLGGALAGGGDNGPRYIDPPPPPPPRCWFEDQRIRNAYDGGSHIESVRVCE